MKIVKFSTILTEQSLKNIEKIILKQYYQIESYIHESSNLIQIKINEFLNEVNNTSLYIDSIKELINCRIRIQFEMLYQLIQSKYEIVQKDKVDKSNIGKDDQNHPQVDPKYIGEDFKNNYGGTRDYIAKSHNFVEEKLNNLNNNNSTGLLKTISEFFGPIKDFYDKLVNLFNHHLPIDIPPIIIPIPFFPYLQLRIIPYVVLQTHLGLEFQIKDTHIGFDLYAKAEVGINFEVGIYIPPEGGELLEISLRVGIKGILGSGKAGMKVYLRFRKMQIITDLYWEFNAFTINFYVKFGIKINIKLFSYYSEFFLLNKQLAGLHKEYHKISNDNFKGPSNINIGKFSFPN